MASSASARAGINIALIKYWGKRDDALKFTVAGSLLTIDTFVTETTVTFAASQPDDVFVLNGRQQDDKRVFGLIDQLSSSLASISVPSLRVQTPCRSAPRPRKLGQRQGACPCFSRLVCAGPGHERSDRKHRFLDVVRRGSGSAPRSLLPGLVRLDKANG